MWSDSSVLVSQPTAWPLGFCPPVVEEENKTSAMDSERTRSSRKEIRLVDSATASKVERLGESVLAVDGAASAIHGQLCHLTFTKSAGAGIQQHHRVPLAGADYASTLVRLRAPWRPPGSCSS